VLGTLLVVAGIAAVDSMNPATIGPALLFTMSAKPARHVLEFAAGFFLANLAGGILLVLGPGKWLLSLVPHPNAHAKYVMAVVGGVALLVLAAGLWLGRGRLARTQEAEQTRPRSGSGFVAGAAIALAELPTAFPYFAAIGVIAAADLAAPADVLLLLVFNVIFVAPVVGIAVVIGLAPGLRTSVLEPTRRWLMLHWPHLVAAVLAAASVALVAVGLAGLSSQSG
jgi:cytochrome c biogenesis protein CcdA